MAFNNSMVIRQIAKVLFITLNLFTLFFGAGLIISAIHRGYDVPISSNGLPLGIDFYCFWSAGRMTLDGRVLDIFNVETLAVFQKNYLNVSGHLSIPWFYPPLLLLYISCLFAVLPYKIAYIVFIFVYISFYIIFARYVFPKISMLFILAFPAFWYNLLLGQNGLLTAVILIGGLLALHNHQRVSGAVLALLSYKPQLCFAVPFFLIVEKKYQAIIAGAIAFVGLIGLSTLLFGLAVWPAFLDGLQRAQNYNQLSGNYQPESLANLYGTLKAIGLTHVSAMQINYLFALLAGCAAIRIWLLSKEAPVKNSAVILMTLLLSPHLNHYEFIVSGAVIIWLWSREYLRPALLMIWLAPMTWLMFPSPGVPMLSIASALILLQLNWELHHPFARK
jgi:alpha-1,2-mannosyltransferase